MLNRLALRALAGVCMAVAVAGAADIPRQAPDFTINMPGGQGIHLNQYRGKIVVMAFILTTCPHCQRTVGFLSKIQNDYAARGVQVLASAIDSMAAMNLPDFIQRIKPSFPVGFNDNDAALEFLQRNKLFRLFMPQLAFIDRQGVIQAQFAGDDKVITDEAHQEQFLRDQVDALLKADASKKHISAKAAKKTS